MKMMGLIKKTLKFQDDVSCQWTCGHRTSGTPEFLFHLSKYLTIIIMIFLLTILSILENIFWRSLKWVSIMLSPLGHSVEAVVHIWFVCLGVHRALARSPWRIPRQRSLLLEWGGTIFWIRFVGSQKHMASNEQLLFCRENWI